jgi:hypothetical protein
MELTPQEAAGDQAIVTFANIVRQVLIKGIERVVDLPFVRLAWAPGHRSFQAVGPLYFTDDVGVLHIREDPSTVQCKYTPPASQVSSADLLSRKGS